MPAPLVIRIDNDSTAKYHVVRCSRAGDFIEEKCTTYDEALLTIHRLRSTESIAEKALMEMFSK